MNINVLCELFQSKYLNYFSMLCVRQNQNALAIKDNLFHFHS
jgi:hypothetical protein